MEQVRFWITIKEGYKQYRYLVEHIPIDERIEHFKVHGRSRYVIEFKCSKLAVREEQPLYLCPLTERGLLVLIRSLFTILYQGQKAIALKTDTPRFVILYAEDDIDDLHMVQDCFEQYSHSIEILHAENGAETLQSLDELQAKGLKPCLIILDINMPGMDGREALMHIKSSNDYKEIPVVLFTTSNSSLDKTFAQKWGADFINKPLQYEEVKDLAHEFMSRCSKEVGK